MRDFVLQMRMPRVVFGAGSLRQVRHEVELIGAERALVLSTPGQKALAERVVGLLGPHAAGVFSRAAMHVPVETVSAAEDVVQRVDANCLVAIGGGSTTGLAKALALDSGVPVIAIPTTYAGSEMTTMYGLTEGGAKRTGRDAAVLPRAVIYDPELSLGLPFAVTVVSAINAIAHAAEGLYAPDGNPVIDLFAEEGIRRSRRGPAAPAAATRATSARAAMRWSAPGCAARSWAASPSACITSSATRSAAASACRMRSCTPWCCRTPSPTTRRRFRRRCRRSLPPCRRRARPPACSTWPRGTARRPRCRRSACSGPTSTAPPTWRCRRQYPNPRPLERAPLRELLQRAWEGVRPD